MGWARAQTGAVRLSMEDVDLAELVDALRSRFARARPTGYLGGRTALRDAVANELGCSVLEAEELVDTLVARGLVRYEGDPREPDDDSRIWSFSA
jgi:hypothetical protein